MAPGVATVGGSRHLQRDWARGCRSVCSAAAGDKDGDKPPSLDEVSRSVCGIDVRLCTEEKHLAAVYMRTSSLRVPPPAFIAPCVSHSGHVRLCGDHKLRHTWTRCTDGSRLTASQEIFGGPLSDADRAEFEREAAAWAAEMGFTARGALQFCYKNGGGLPPCHVPRPQDSPLFPSPPASLR